MGHKWAEAWTPTSVGAEPQGGILAVPPCMETVFPCQEPKQSKVRGDMERIYNSTQAGKQEGKVYSYAVLLRCLRNLHHTETGKRKSILSSITGTQAPVPLIALDHAHIYHYRPDWAFKQCRLLQDQFYWPLVSLLRIKAKSLPLTTYRATIHCNSAPKFFISLFSQALRLTAFPFCQCTVSTGCALSLRSCTGAELRGHHKHSTGWRHSTHCKASPAVPATSLLCE